MPLGPRWRIGVSTIGRAWAGDLARRTAPQSGGLRAFALALGLIGASAAPIAASAVEADYRLRPSDSSLRIAYAEDGDEQAGRFTRFEASGRIDPSNPSKARLTLRIDMQSLALPDALRTQFVQSADWLDTGAHPQAAYALEQLIRLSGDSYVAIGALRLKGVERRVSDPVELSFKGDRARARGTLKFNRRDFDVGGGPASLFIDVGETISVSFDLTAEAAR